MVYLSLLRWNLIATLTSWFDRSLVEKRRWWLKIDTRYPPCTYYFGPYDRWWEAMAERGGFVEDLQGEGAIGIGVGIDWGNPEVLTIDRVEKKSAGIAGELKKSY
ncbi:DUF1816 domain-containing protein [Pannus brasiliensis CCIBt3594]|uniref:DUF1816 domain-containing protein n=1 Tax=Pannus brasiliensis CCIBt3594 TaxID=1427578 RepID=A0AAW9QEU1_9CHRO